MLYFNIIAIAFNDYSSLLAMLKTFLEHVAYFFYIHGDFVPTYFHSVFYLKTGCH